jgi:hypothetical protein
MTHADDATPQRPVMAPAETLPRGRRGLAVAAVVAGMLSVAAGFSLLLAPFAFVFGVLALRGDGMARLMALTGMFFAAVSVIVALMPVLFVVGFH